MKKIMLALIASSSLFAAADVQAGGFDGLYAALKGGVNDSSIAGAPSHGLGDGFVGGEVGYNASMDGLLVGADLWADDRRLSVTGRDWGADMKLGRVQEDTLYYVKLGVAETNPGARPHYGVGAEHKFTQKWGALAEVTYDSKTNNAVTYINWDYFLGVTYHF